MNVAIVFASSSAQLSGVQRHAINLARCLLSRPETTAVHLVTAPWQLDFVRDSAPVNDARLHVYSAPIGNTSLSRNLWYFIRLPRLVKQLRCDIVHLAYPVPLRRGAFHCPTVVTLHDLYVYDIPENFGFPKVLFNRLALRACLAAADAIACASQYTLSRLKELRPDVATTRSHVIYNVVEPRPLSSSKISPSWGERPFLLCVSQHRRNKNIALAVRTLDRLLHTGRIAPDAQLLVVGIPGPETSSIERLVTGAGLTQNVIFLNGISDEQLHWCYRNCQALLAPSLIEGFGLPVAEAMLAGCPVICSDIPAFREFGGSYCHYVPFGAQELEAFADAVCAVSGQRNREALLMPQLSAAVIAAQYMQLYTSLLSPPGREMNVKQPSLLPQPERRSRI